MMQENMRRRVTTRECQRCGHVWLPAKLSTPQVCPKRRGTNSGCGSVRWNKPQPAEFFRLTYQGGTSLMGHADSALDIWSRDRPDEAQVLRVRWQNRTLNAIEFADEINKELARQEEESA
jgi:hypothetical protein